MIVNQLQLQIQRRRNIVRINYVSLQQGSILQICGFDLCNNLKRLREQMQKGGKKKQSYDKGYPSDDEIMQQLKDEIRQIRQSGRNQVQIIQRIHELYNEHRQSKRRRKMLQRGNDKKYSYDNKKQNNDSESQQPGQINEAQPKRKQRQTHEQDLTIQEKGQLTKQVTLTRKRLIDFLDNRKFNDLVKGCFVRYKGDNSKDDSYMIAQIIGVKQGTKEYTLTSKHKTKILLVIQQSTIKIVELPIEMISNQGISGTTQITRWIQQNGDKIPKERQIKEKLEQHNRLLTEQLSSQEIDKNILNRAIALSKGSQQVKSFEDLQNLLDFIIQKYENFEALEAQELAKRKDEPLQLIQIRRKKQQYNEVMKNLQQKKREYLQTRGLSGKNEKGPERNQRSGGTGLKIEEKREDEIKQKWRLREMMLCTAEGYEKIRANMIQNHSKFSIEIDI